MIKKVCGYIRVSTESQAEENKYGVEVQRQIIQEYADKNNMEIAEWFIDKISGAKVDRPEFGRILNGAVENPPIECVLLAKSDRLARDINIYYWYKMELKKRSIEVISVSEDFGQLGTMAAIALESFIAIAAAMERENITMRTSAGRRAKAKTGAYAGGRAAMGYKIENHELVINENEAPVVRRVFELKADGVNMLNTVYTLNREGYKTRHGKEFLISSVQSMWGNERFYRGEYKYGKEGVWVPGTHEPILKG